MTRYLVNPLFLYLAVWISVTGLYVAGVNAEFFPSPSPLIWWAVALNVTAFSLGCGTWGLWRRRTTDGAECCAFADSALTAQSLRRYLKITLLFGVLAVALCAVRVAVLAWTYEIELSRLIASSHLWRQTLTRPIAPNMMAARLCTIAITVTCSVFSVGFVLLGILLYLGRGRSRHGIVILFLLTALGVGLLSLARKEVTINILFMALSYLCLHQRYRTRRPREVARHLVVPVVALVLLFALVDVLLRKGAIYDPGRRLMGFLVSIYWYLAAPLAAFGEFLKTHDHDWYLGQSVFLPFYKWLARLHLVPPADAMSIIHMEKLHIPYMVNVYTYLRNIYEDFGFFGLAVIPYLLGLLAGGIRRRAERFLPYLNFYMIVLVVLVFSFYDHLLVSNQYYLQAFFGFLLFRSRLPEIDADGL